MIRLYFYMFGIYSTKFISFGDKIIKLFDCLARESSNIQLFFAFYFKFSASAIIFHKLYIYINYIFYKLLNFIIIF